MVPTQQAPSFQKGTWQLCPAWKGCSISLPPALSIPCLQPRCLMAKWPRQALHQQHRVASAHATSHCPAPRHSFLELVRWAYYTGENNFSSTLSTPNSCNTIALTPIVLLFILSWPVIVQKSLTLTIKRMNQVLTSFLWVEETQRHSSSTSPSPPPAAEPKAMQETQARTWGMLFGACGAAAVLCSWVIRGEIRFCKYTKYIRVIMQKDLGKSVKQSLKWWNI